MMDKELEERLSERGLNLIMEEIAKKYNLVVHIKSYLPYPYGNSNHEKDSEWFLMQHDLTKSRDLIIEFQSECEVKRQGYNRYFSWPNSYDCYDVCLAISSSGDDLNTEFILPSYNPACTNKIELFREKVIKNSSVKDKDLRINTLFERNYFGSDMRVMPYFERHLLGRIEKYSEILSKGNKIEPIVWRCDKELEIIL